MRSPNRRSTPRRVLRTEATLIRSDDTISVQTWDISSDGVSFMAPVPVSPGRRCEVKFSIPIGQSSENFAALVKIVFSSYVSPANFKIGAVFHDLSDEAASAINLFTGRSEA